MFKSAARCFNSESNGTEDVVPDGLDPLVLDLVEWVSKAPRSYPELIDAWRTSCPRLTVWEDAVDRGFVSRQGGEHGGMVVVTSLGLTFLHQHGRGSNGAS
jgi:hypothetical protein